MVAPDRPWRPRCPPPRSRSTRFCRMPQGIFATTSSPAKLTRASIFASLTRSTRSAGVSGAAWDAPLKVVVEGGLAKAASAPSSADNKSPASCCASAEAQQADNIDQIQSPAVAQGIFRHACRCANAARQLARSIRYAQHFALRVPDRAGMAGCIGAAARVAENALRRRQRTWCDSARWRFWRWRSRTPTLLSALEGALADSPVLPQRRPSTAQSRAAPKDLPIACSHSDNSWSQNALSYSVSRSSGTAARSAR